MKKILLINETLSIGHECLCLFSKKSLWRSTENINCWLRKLLYF